MPEQLHSDNETRSAVDTHDRCDRCTRESTPPTSICLGYTFAGHTTSKIINAAMQKTIAIPRYQ